MTRVGTALLALLAVGLASGGAAAAPLRLKDAPAEMRYVPARVALLPLRDYAAAPAELLSVTEAAERVWRRRALERTEQALVDTLRADPRVKLMVAEDLRRALNAAGRYEQGKEVTTGFLGIGREFYDALSHERAAENLLKAQASAQALYQDILEPDLVADAELLLGLTWLESGRAAEAHIAFKRLFALRPTIRFQKGYHSARAERAFEAALTDFAATAARDLPVELDRLEALLTEVGADLVVTGQLVRTEEGIAFLLVIYDRRSRSFAVREEVPVGGSPADAERLDRTLSAWLTCTTVPVVGERQAPVERPLHPGVYIDTSFAHAFYLENPARKQFHNLGFAVNASGRLKDHLDLFAKVGLYTSLPDPLQDLQTTLNSVRVLVGAGFTFGNDLIRGYVHPGVDLHYLGDFEVITDPSCKFWGRSDPRCDASSITAFEAALLFGINVSAGLDLMLTNEVFLTVQANFTLYFPFSDASSDLNYLTGYEAGAGIHF